MGRRRRRIVKVFKRKLPTVFDCPVCGENSIKIHMKKNVGKALILCGVCKLKEEFDVPKFYENIDIYCIFVDNFYKKIKYTA